MSTAMTKKNGSDDAIEAVSARATAKPRVDIYENSDEFVIVADLPGVQRDQLRLDLDADRLTLATDREGTNYLRTFAIPREIDRDKVEAKLEAGVLSLHLPKSAAVKPRQITVTAG